MKSDVSKEHMARELWLDHFNKVLYQKGVISEKEYRSMSRLIAGAQHKP